MTLCHDIVSRCVGRRGNQNTPTQQPALGSQVYFVFVPLYCPQDRGCGHVPNALRANRAYATRLGQGHQGYLYLYWEDKLVKQLKLSDGWIHDFLARFHLTRHRVTTHSKAKPATEEKVRAFAAEVAEIMRKT
jgi:hypothetical protein